MINFTKATTLNVGFDKFEGSTESYRDACDDGYTNRRAQRAASAVSQYLRGEIDFLTFSKKIESIEMEVIRFAARKTGHRGQYTGGAMVGIGAIVGNDEDGFAESIGLTGELVADMREGFQRLAGTYKD